MTDIKVQTVPIDKPQPDPANARLHDDRNLEAIRGSLRKFGQVRPLILWGEVVIAGNGTLQAAKSLGWTEIAISRVPRDWTYEQARAYALADNRTAELASWDADLLSDQLVELDSMGWDVSEFGFPELNPPTDPELHGAGDGANEKYGVIVDVPDADTQAALLKRLHDEGYKVRATSL